jgi:DNA polymerase-1
MRSTPAGRTTALSRSPKAPSRTRRSISTLLKAGKTKITFDAVGIDQATEYAAEKADIVLRLWQVLKPRLPPSMCSRSTRRWSGRCLRVLARMERRGISIDRQVLSRLSGEFAQEARVSKPRSTIAGEPINPGSPKQLGDILFGKLGLPGGTKTKTGQWSTGARALEELAEQGPRAAAENPRLAAGLEAEIDLYRRAAGLRQSDDAPRPYQLRAGLDHDRAAVVVRAEFAEHPGPHRGRPKDPPRLHRRARHKLVSADYSQIELRLLAEIAGIEPLQQRRSARASTFTP